MYPVPRNYPLNALNTVSKAANDPKRKKKIVYRPKAGIIFLLVAAGYVLFSFGRLEWQARQVEDEIAFYQAQKQALEAETGELQQRIRSMNSNAYVEGVARKELGLIYPGEKVLLRAQPGQVMPLNPSDPLQEIAD